MRTWLMIGLLVLAGCAGPVNDYATAVNAAAEEGLDNTSKQLGRKHDTELEAYMLAFCNQPRAGALMRRWSDAEIQEYMAFCRGQRQ